MPNANTKSLVPIRSLRSSALFRYSEGHQECYLLKKELSSNQGYKI